MKKTTLAITGALLLTSACSTNVGRGMLSQEAGRIELVADEKGMRAFSDMMTGAIVTGKSEPNKVDSHHLLREQQEQTERLKYTSESFMGRKEGGNTNER